MSTGLKNKIPDDKFFGHKGQEKAGKNLCKVKTGATKEIKWLRKLRERFSLRETSGKRIKWTGRNHKTFCRQKIPPKDKGGRQKRKTAGFKAESFLPTPSEEESQL